MGIEVRRVVEGILDGSFTEEKSNTSFIYQSFVCNYAGKDPR